MSETLPTTKPNSLSSRPRRRKLIQQAFLPIDPEQLAIAGDYAENPEGDNTELCDVTNGQHFLYYFEGDRDELGEFSLEDCVREGAAFFARRFQGYPAQAVILSASYGWPPQQPLAGLQVIEVPDIPPGHFWFGPKPPFYQLSFPLD